MNDCCVKAVTSRQPIHNGGKPVEIGTPNQITINPGWNDIPGVGQPTLVFPLQCPDDIGGMIAHPGTRRVAPAAAFLNDQSMIVYNLQGYYGCFLPFAGDWKVHYGGASAIQCKMLDMSNPNLAQILDSGCYAVPQYSTASVGVASGVAMAANPFADYREFINDSANLIYLKGGSVAVIGEGIRLNPNGGSHVMSRKLGNLWRGSMRAIAGGAASNLTMVQGGIAVPT